MTKETAICGHISSGKAFACVNPPNHEGEHAYQPIGFFQTPAQRDQLLGIIQRQMAGLPAQGLSEAPLADEAKAAERVRIRRELLDWLDPEMAALKARNAGASLDPLSIHDSSCIGLLSELRRVLDRICPAGEGKE